MTDDDLRHAQVLRRLGDWEGVLRLYYRSWLPDKDQPPTHLFDKVADWHAWNLRNPGLANRI